MISKAHSVSNSDLTIKRGERRALGPGKSLPGPWWEVRVRGEAVSTQPEGLVSGLRHGGPGREMQRRSPGVLTSSPAEFEGPRLAFGLFLSYQV